MELKVYCDCGQKFKFDVEPVNGQMPFTVACPVCNRDGTEKANSMLQQMSVFKQVEPASTSTPGAIAPPPISAPPPSTAAPAKLRINVAAHAASPAETAIAPPPIAPTLGAGPITGRPRLGMAPAVAAEPGKTPSFAMGLLGALIGAAVGSLLYFLIFKIIGPIPFIRYPLALGVGGLTGWLANFLGKEEGSKELGGLAAVFTIIGIIGAQYFLQMAQFHQIADTDGVSQIIADGGYAVNVKEANEVVKAIPTGSDAEIRMYIAKQQVEDGQAPKLETVSSDEVKQFRDNELTNYTDLASGKQTKEQYWARINFDPKAAQKAQASEEKTFGALALLIGVLRAGIVSMVVGAGLAFRLSANA